MKHLLALFFTLISPLAASDFCFTDEEYIQVEKWKNAPYEVDALMNDAAGLYVLGMYHLLGQHGNSIDVARAHTFFAASASLGFGPSLNKIKSKCQDNDKNIFLSLVYLNLTASAGHPEIVMQYHAERAQIAAQHGEAIALEIEKIASEKRAAITQNANKSNTRELLSSGGITSQDATYSHAYWKSLQP